MDRQKGWEMLWFYWGWLMAKPLCEKGWRDGRLQCRIGSHADRCRNLSFTWFQSKIDHAFHSMVLCVFTPTGAPMFSGTYTGTPALDCTFRRLPHTLGCKHVLTFFPFLLLWGHCQACVSLSFSLNIPDSMGRLNITRGAGYIPFHQRAITSKTESCQHFLKRSGPFTPLPNQIFMQIEPQHESTLAQEICSCQCSL